MNDSTKHSFKKNDTRSLYPKSSFSILYVVMYKRERFTIAVATKPKVEMLWVTDG